MIYELDLNQYIKLTRIYDKHFWNLGQRRQLSKTYQ